MRGTPLPRPTVWLVRSALVSRARGVHVKRRKLLALMWVGTFAVAACTNSSVPVNGTPAASSTLIPSTTTIVTTDVVGGPGDTVGPHAESDAAAGSDPAADEQGVVDTAFIPLDLAVGTCFDDPQDDTALVTPDNVPIVDCVSPHDNEVFGEFDIGGEAFPGAAAVQNQADALCSGAFEGYVGAAYESSVYDFSWYFPTAESWPIGGTNIICFAYNSDLSSITGSVEGTGR